MRRRYGDAGDAAARVSTRTWAAPRPRRCSTARARCRAPIRDDEAIVWYRKVVAHVPDAPTYAAGGAVPRRLARVQPRQVPGGDRAARGARCDAIRSRSGSTTRCGSSACRTTSSASGPRRAAAPRGAREARRLARGRQGQLLARAHRRAARRASADAIAGYTATVERYPFSWYALPRTRPAARARRRARRRSASPIAEAARPKLAATRRRQRSRPIELIARADELIAAGLVVDAGNELARGERAVPQAPRSRRRVRDAARSLPQGRQLQPPVDARDRLRRRRARRPARRATPRAGGRTRIRAPTAI